MIKDPNIRTYCPNHIKELYPLKGKFSIETVRAAKIAKFRFQEGEVVEWMWIYIHGVKDNGIVYGVLDNEPYMIQNIKFKDKINRHFSEVAELQFDKGDCEA